MLVLEFIFRALPHIFRAKSIQPPPKMARTPMVVYGKRRKTVECPSVCLSRRSTTAAAGGGFAAEVRRGQQMSISNRLLDSGSLEKTYKKIMHTQNSQHHIAGNDLVQID